MAYNFPTDITGSTEDPTPDEWANAVGDALNDATDAATASVLVLRDASGRAKFASPSADSDAATKAYVDGVVPDDASTSAKGIVELATNAETQTGTDGTRAVTPAGLASRTATESRTGVAEIATVAEVTAGSDDSRFVTPLKLKAVSVLAVGSANNPHTSSTAARNATLPKNFWQCATEPDNWVDGDEWIETDA